MTQTQSSGDPILQPFRLKHLVLKNRIMSTSHACGLEDTGGLPGERYQRYHEEKALGGLALTMFGGSSYVDKDSTWASAQLNVSDDRIIPYLQSFANRIHAYGTALMIQITHLGRRGEPNSQNWLPTVAPSPIRETGHRSIPREIDTEDIRRIVKAFGEAAWRCKEGGLDGVEVMTAGHLIGQFFSPVTNRRSDEFGGSMENRCRFGLMVYEEIRRKVGPEFIVGMRFLVDEAQGGGLTFDESLEIAKRFEHSGLVDFFNTNYGRLDTEIGLAVNCMPGMASPIAPWLEMAGNFKREIGIPVFHAARITDLGSARYAIGERLLDMVAMTRAHIADPHIVNKIQRGEEHRIRPCVGASYCMGESRPTCVHNAAAGRELAWPQVISPSQHQGRKIVVVGAGPAGLEAARISAERGHEVVVFEAAAEAGGQVRLAAVGSWRRDLTAIIDWRCDELAALEVTIRTNYLVGEAEILAERPDVVILATGGEPNFDWLPGGEYCTTAWDVLSGAVPVGEKVLIYDGTGRHPGPTAIERCHRAGAEVTSIMLDDRTGAELAYAERVIWKRTLAKLGVATNGDLRLVEVTPHRNQLLAHFVHELTEESRQVIADQVVVEHGTVPSNELFEAIRGHSSNQGVIDNQALTAGQPQPSLESSDNFSLFRIGDALSSRNIAAAMFDALRLCSAI